MPCLYCLLFIISLIIHDLGLHGIFTLYYFYTTTSLYREKTEPDKVTDWDDRIQECARITADRVLDRVQTMLDATISRSGLEAVAGTVADADNPVEADVGMAPPKAVEELSDEVDDFLNYFYGYM